MYSFVWHDILQLTKLKYVEGEGEGEEGVTGQGGAMYTAAHGLQLHAQSRDQETAHHLDHDRPAHYSRTDQARGVDTSEAGGAACRKDGDDEGVRSGVVQDAAHSESAHVAQSAGGGEPLHPLQPLTRETVDGEGAASDGIESQRGRSVVNEEHHAGEDHHKGGDSKRDSDMRAEEEGQEGSSLTTKTHTHTHTHLDDACC